MSGGGLFNNAINLFRAAAASEFRRTEIGRLLSEVDRARHSPALMRDVMRRVGPRLRQLGAGGVANAVRSTESGRLVSEVAKYGKTSDVVRELLKALGPMGDMIGALIRPGGSRLATAGRELTTAANLLKAFGYNVKPPRGGTGGRAAKRSTVEASRELLESLGFKVTPPPGWEADDSESGARRISTGSTESDESDGSNDATERPAWLRRPNGAIVTKIGGRRREFQPDDPVLTGEMVAVQSSNVHSIGFIWNKSDPTKGTLKVRFLQSAGPGSGVRGAGKKKAAGPMYFYYDVHPEVFASFRQASSKGRFVWDRLRIRGTVSGHRFRYELKGITGGYVPRKATRYGQSEYFIGRQVKVRSKDGTVRTMSSKLPDRHVQTIDRNFRGWPDRGGPSRGTPNRGR